jgi:hypothetical protein
VNFSPPPQPLLPDADPESGHGHLTAVISRVESEIEAIRRRGNGDTIAFFRLDDVAALIGAAKCTRAVIDNCPAPSTIREARNALDAAHARLIAATAAQADARDAEEAAWKSLLKLEVADA